MGVPRKMLVKEYSKVFGFSSRGQRSTAEVNREGRKRAQILSGSEGEKFELKIMISRKVRLFQRGTLARCYK